MAETVVLHNGDLSFVRNLSHELDTFGSRDDMRLLHAADHGNDMAHLVVLLVDFESDCVVR